MLLVSGLSAVIFIPLKNHLADWANSQDLERFVWLIPLAALVLGVYGVFSRWAVRENRYSLISRTRIAQGFGSVITKILLGLSTAGPLGLVAGGVVERGIGASSLTRLTTRNDWERLRSGGVKQVLGAARRYRKFPLVSSWAALLMAVTSALPPFLVSSLHGPEVAGWYGMTLRVIGIPSSLVGGAVALVYFGRGANAAATCPAEFRRMFFSMSRKVALTGAVVFAPVVAASPWVLPVLLGERWRPVGIYLAILAPMYYAALVSSPFDATLVIAERQGLFLVREIVRATLIFVFFILSRSLKLSPLASVSALSAAGTLGYVVYYFVSRYAVLGFHCDV